ncbi:hypothetical protein DMB68_13605 [Flavobacterium hydrophilum]|uniref:Uncharacterized protein n=1 Tax=Flavobacterium hydrophilum TaxID=2211445 RepID=A0A2V4BZN9_9FLAO|nr:hypothetical protein DMB68_13605 [Flavobacterium hydrophilum]
MEYVFIAVIIIAIMLFGLAVGWFLAKISDKDDSTTETIKTLQELYCFECEIEMPVKEKNGRYYCTNCKLYHDNEYI